MELPNNGQVGDERFVHCSEVVPSSEVASNRQGVNSLSVVGRLYTLQGVHYRRFHCTWLYKYTNRRRGTSNHSGVPLVLMSLSVVFGTVVLRCYCSTKRITLPAIDCLPCDIRLITEQAEMEIVANSDESSKNNNSKS